SQASEVANRHGSKECGRSNEGTATKGSNEGQQGSAQRHGARMLNLPNVSLSLSAAPIVSLGLGCGVAVARFVGTAAGRRGTGRQACGCSTNTGVGALPRRWKFRRRPVQR